MKTRSTIIASVSAALMLGTAAFPAQALDLSLGGIDISAGSDGNDGTEVSAGTGDTSVDATLGGGSNIATAEAGTGDTDAILSVGSTEGELVELNNDDGTTSGLVNLGGLGLGDDGNTLLNGVTGPTGETLDGLDLGGLPGVPGLPGLPGGGGGGGGASAQQFASAFDQLAPADQAALRLRCQAVLDNPASFDSSVVALCRLIATL